MLFTKDNEMSDPSDLITFASRDLPLRQKVRSISVIFHHQHSPHSIRIQSIAVQSYWQVIPNETYLFAKCYVPPDETRGRFGECSCKQKHVKNGGRWWTPFYTILIRIAQRLVELMTSVIKSTLVFKSAKYDILKNKMMA